GVLEKIARGKPLYSRRPHNLQGSEVLENPRLQHEPEPRIPGYLRPPHGCGAFCYIEAFL
ncbi:MAG: hypothetical protein QXK97_02060, partial [Acidilobaceae archaeon]